MRADWVKTLLIAASLLLPSCRATAPTESGEAAGDGAAQTDIIVRFKGPPPDAPPYGVERPRARARIVEGLRARQAVERRRLIEALHGEGEVERDLWVINGVALRVPAREVGRIASLPNVAGVTADRLLAAPLPSPGLPPRLSGWNLALLGVDTLWQRGIDGAGVVVAGLDTGVDAAHPDLASRWRAGGNGWFDPYGERMSPWDSIGHGTQTMGIAVGGGGIGVAPGARWIAAKIFNDAGVGRISAIHASFQWILDPDGNPATDDAPDIVTASWGLDAGLCNPEFEGDIRALDAAGIVATFAAGNSGPGGGTGASPANYAESIAAGAIDAQGAIAPFSSRGPSPCGGALFPSLALPGVNVKTTDLTFGGAVPSPYRYVSGTSYAAPHLAGVLALLKGAVPKATPEQLRAALQLTARDVGIPGPDADYGLGIPDLPAALDSLTTGTEPILLTEGEVAAGRGWRSVSIVPLHSAPLVIADTFAGEGGVALRQVTAQGFEIRARRERGEATPVRAGYYVLAPGRYLAPDGAIWEAGSATVGRGRWQGVNFSHGGMGRVPQLFVTLQESTGDEARSVAIRALSAGGFEASLVADGDDEEGREARIAYLALVRRPQGQPLWLHPLTPG